MNAIKEKQNQCWTWHFYFDDNEACSGVVVLPGVSLTPQVWLLC